MVVKKSSFKLELYDITVKIILCDTASSVTEEGNKIIKKGSEEYITFLCKGLCINLDKYPNVIYILLSKEDLNVSLICHEVEHCKNYIIDQLSIHDNTENKESYSNLSGFLNEKVFSFLKKTGFAI